MAKNKAKTQKIEGQVTEALPNTMFRVELKTDRTILATLSGRMRKNYVRIFPGDKVLVEITAYDEDRGRIVYKLK